MILRLLLIAGLVASAGQAQLPECPPADPVEAERLSSACEVVLSREVQAQLHALAEKLAAPVSLEQLDHSALSTALSKAAASLESAVVVVDLRHCRFTSTAEDDCEPTLNILNIGLPGYDPKDLSSAGIAERPRIGRMTAHAHREFQPPAFTELQCHAFSPVSEVPPNPSLQRTSPGRSPGFGR